MLGGRQSEILSVVVCVHLRYMSSLCFSGLIETLYSPKGKFCHRSLSTPSQSHEVKPLSLAVSDVLACGLRPRLRRREFARGHDLEAE